MPQHAYMAKMDVEEFLGEWHPLVDQLGSSEELLPLNTATAVLNLPQIKSPDSLQIFLESYKAEVLIPRELPAILRAYRHACRHETKELIDFDQSLAAPPASPALARASARAGRQQLRRLRPLRDHRLLQRYIRAVEAGRAQGWHTLVYGLTLSIYSLPVLQGLAFYERQTLRGFVHGAARSLGLPHRRCVDILDRVCADLDLHFGDDPGRTGLASASR